MNIQLKKYQGASDDDIARVENDIGVKFSPDYREFLSKYDGATPEENVLEGDEYVSIDRFIPISELRKVTSNDIEGLPEDALPIAEAPSGNLIYLKEGDFSVCFWDHEIEKGDRKLAPSFGAFIQRLVPFDSESIQLQPGQVRSVWVDPDFKPKF